MVQSVWRMPELTWRFWPVFLRNLLVWRKLAIPSLVGNIAEPLMWLVGVWLWHGGAGGAGDGAYRRGANGHSVHPVSGQRFGLPERHAGGFV